MKLKLLIIFFTLTLASCMVVDNNPYQRKGQTYQIDQTRQKVRNAKKVDQTPRIVISPNQKNRAISYNPNQKNRANSSYNPNQKNRAISSPNPNQKNRVISSPNPNQKKRVISSPNQIRNVNPSAGQKKAQTKEADDSSRKRQQSYSQ